MRYNPNQNPKPARYNPNPNQNPEPAHHQLIDEFILKLELANNTKDNYGATEPFQKFCRLITGEQYNNLIEYLKDGKKIQISQKMRTNNPRLSDEEILFRSTKEVIGLITNVIEMSENISSSIDDRKYYIENSINEIIKKKRMFQT